MSGYCEKNLVSGLSMSGPCKNTRRTFNVRSLQKHPADFLCPVPAKNTQRTFNVRVLRKKPADFQCPVPAKNTQRTFNVRVLGKTHGGLSMSGPCGKNTWRTSNVRFLRKKPTDIECPVPAENARRTLNVRRQKKTAGLLQAVSRLFTIPSLEEFTFPGCKNRITLLNCLQVHKIDDKS